MFRHSRFLTDFRADGLDRIPLRKLNHNFHHKLCQATSNRDDFWINLFVSINKQINPKITVNIRKEALSIKHSSDNDVRLYRIRKGAYCGIWSKT